MFNRVSFLFPPLHLPPLIGIAIAYISGIALHWMMRGTSIYDSVWLTLFGISVALLIAALTHYIEYRKPIILCTLFLFLGCWRSYYSYATFEGFPFNEFRQPVTITGIITGSSYSSKGRMRHCLTLFAKEARTANDTVKPINHTIQVYLARKPALAVGDRIAIHDIKLATTNNSAFKEHLIKEGVLASLFLTHFSYTLVSRPFYSVHRWLWELREKLVHNVSKKLSPSIHAFFCAIFLGNRSINKQKVEIISDQFKQWGAVHYMVRAGLHLVMFVGIWFSLLSFIPIRFATKQIVMILICLLYYVLSWSSIAFMRALLTFLFYKGITLFNLNTHSLHIITLVTLLVLFVNPMQLFFLDFQLSFSVTFALAWFNHMYVSPPAQSL